MDIHTYRCSSCGKPGCCDVYHKQYTRYHERLTQLLAQPEVDPQEVWFLMFLISALDRRFHVIQENAS
jgi:hypothetical protein